MVKKYDREFKIEAVRLAKEPSNTAAKVEPGPGDRQKGNPASLMSYAVVVK